MSINMNCLFKKGKNINNSKGATKVNNSQLYSKQLNNIPKKIDYTRLLESSRTVVNHMSENVVQNTVDNYGSNNDE